MEEARSEIAFLPDEVLLMIFSYLGLKDLQLAEQVCGRWKAVVQTRFATIKILDLRRNREESDCVELVKRYGPSLQTLFMPEWIWRSKQLHWINYIAEAFPNLKSLSLTNLIIENEDFRTLSMKCSQLIRISFCNCTISDEGLGLLLKGLPGLQYLRLYDFTSKGDLEECFRNLGDNIEYLSLTCWGMEITTAGLSHLFSKCKKVKTLELSGDFDCGESFSNWCQENVYVQKLLLGHNSDMFTVTTMAFSQISRLSMLEELDLQDCDEVESDTLIGISRGCLNLRRVKLYCLPNICDRGVKSLSGCRNLSDFTFTECNGLTEESLVELSKSGRLKRMEICDSWVSNSSCATILGHCPQLEELDVSCCKGVVDGIVDIAIEAIANRANGVVLHLHIENTGVDPEKEIRTHPSLRVYRRLKDPFESYYRNNFTV